jgi:hypothetical protein
MVLHEAIRSCNIPEYPYCLDSEVCCGSEGLLLGRQLPLERHFCGQMTFERQTEQSNQKPPLHR